MKVHYDYRRVTERRFGLGPLSLWRYQVFYRYAITEPHPVHGVVGGEWRPLASGVRLGLRAAYRAGSKAMDDHEGRSA